MALVEIATFADPLAAELARGHLAMDGIDAILFGGGVAGLGLGLLNPVRLMVEERHRDRAEALLDEG